MADDQPLGMGERLGQHRRHESRRRRGDDRRRIAGGVDRVERGVLQVEPFGHALDDSSAPAHASSIEAHSVSDPTDVGRRREIELSPRAQRVGVHLGEDLLGLRRRVVDAHVDAADPQPSHPAGADHAAADSGGGVDGGSGCHPVSHAW